MNQVNSEFSDPCGPIHFPELSPIKYSAESDAVSQFAEAGEKISAAFQGD
jgi:hypothetical protein